MKQFWERIGGTGALLLATGLGAGFAPRAPGTVGSLWGIPLVWFLQSMNVSTIGQIAVATLLFLIGIPICGRASRQLSIEDPPQIVFDEIAPFPLVFIAVPLVPLTAVIGFLWFRLFDILKPWPIHRLERLHGGLGIMLDDLVAGLYAAVALWSTVWVFDAVGFL